MSTTSVTPSDVAARADFMSARTAPPDSNGCHLWVGRISLSGYGTASIGGAVTFFAHRAAWMLAHGTHIPNGMVIDHLCRVRNCVNPEHLELVTPAENNRRALPYLRGMTRTRPELRVNSNGTVVYRVRFRIYPDGKRVHTSRTFATESEALKFIQQNRKAA